MGANIYVHLASDKLHEPKINTERTRPFLVAADKADVSPMKMLLALNSKPARGKCREHVAADGGHRSRHDGSAGRDWTDDKELEATTALPGLGDEINAADDNRENARHVSFRWGLPFGHQLPPNRRAHPEPPTQLNKHGWTSLLIVDGYRPGHFQPAQLTIAPVERPVPEEGLSTDSSHPRHIGTYQDERLAQSTP